MALTRRAAQTEAQESNPDQKSGPRLGNDRPVHAAAAERDVRVAQIGWLKQRNLTQTDVRSAHARPSTPTVMNVPGAAMMSSMLIDCEGDLRPYEGYKELVGVLPTVAAEMLFGGTLQRLLRS